MLQFEERVRRFVAMPKSESNESNWNVAYVRRQRKSNEFECWSYVWEQWYINYLLDIQNRARCGTWLFFHLNLRHEYSDEWKYSVKNSNSLKLEVNSDTVHCIKDNDRDTNSLSVFYTALNRIQIEQLVNIQYPLEQWHFFSEIKIELFSVCRS